MVEVPWEGEASAELLDDCKLLGESLAFPSYWFVS